MVEGFEYPRDFRRGIVWGILWFAADRFSHGKDVLGVVLDKYI